MSYISQTLRKLFKALTFHIEGVSSDPAIPVLQHVLQRHNTNHTHVIFVVLNYYCRLRVSVMFVVRVRISYQEGLLNKSI